jgi:hypothetical protein
MPESTISPSQGLRIWLLVKFLYRIKISWRKNLYEWQLENLPNRIKEKSAKFRNFVCVSRIFTFFLFWLQEHWAAGEQRAGPPGGGGGGAGWPGGWPTGRLRADDRPGQAAEAHVQRVPGDHPVGFIFIWFFLLWIFEKL